MEKKYIIVLGLIVLLAVGGVFIFMQSQQAVAPTTGSQAQEQGQTQNTVSEPPPPTTQVEGAKTYEVVYSNSGYSPSSLTIHVGDTVTFKNQSSFGMWTASAIHPSHTIYSGTSVDEHCPDKDNVTFDECKADQSGQSWSFTFTKAGTWRYHNHVQASHFGTIIVE